MKKIMFICTGNICRSAMAHALMEKKVAEKELDIKVFSSGLYAEDGDYATYNAIEAMEEYGVDLKKHKATNTKNTNIQEMDLILSATMGHKVMLLQMYPELKEKIYTMKEYIGEQEKDIKDPWGYNLEIYRKCAQEIYDCVLKIIDKEENIE